MTHHIWEGPVGISLRPKRNSITGEYFWVYRLTRFAGEDNDGQKRYFNTFSNRDNESVGKVLSRAMSYMAQNDPANAADGDLLVKQAA